MKPSELIAMKLHDVGGSASIPLLNGGYARITLKEDSYFVSDKLPGQDVNFSIFDIVVDFLKSQPHHRANKGNCIHSEVGGPKCTKDTVIYAIATEYYDKKEGESSLDPLFVIAAILDWANVARNRRGYVELINV